MEDDFWEDFFKNGEESSFFEEITDEYNKRHEDDLMIANLETFLGLKD